MAGRPLGTCATSTSQTSEPPTIPEGGLPMLTLSNDDPGLGGSVCDAGGSLPASAVRSLPSSASHGAEPASALGLGDSVADSLSLGLGVLDEVEPVDEDPDELSSEPQPASRASGSRAPPNTP